MSGKVQEKKNKFLNNEIKDVIIYAVVVVLFVFIIVSRLSGVEADEMRDAIIGLISDVSIYIVGVVGIFESCYDKGHTIFVPSLFINSKEKRHEKQTKEAIHAFFDKESEYLRCHEADRLADTLSIMGLSADGYQVVQSKVLEARLAPLRDIESARKKMMDLIFYSNSVIDMHNNSDQMNSKGLRYYMKIHDLMHNSLQSNQIARIMATFICLTCESEGINLSEVDVIMVPNSSNYLLGLEVSKLLGKRFIKMIVPNKKISNYSYEGVIPRKYGSNDVNVLIVHDVLLTGEQIEESARDLRHTVPNCQILGLFSLVYRNTSDGKKKLENNYGIKCYSLAELTEEDIEKEIELRGKK